jgi:hypothetical protein
MNRFAATVLSFFIFASSTAAWAELSLTPTTASPLETPRPAYNPGAFNPAMGLVLDAVADLSAREPDLTRRTLLRQLRTLAALA